MNKVTYFTLNESEFSLILKDLSLSEGLRRYPNKLLVILESKGVFYFDGKEGILVPAYHVQPVDTVGVGDTFNGAFAVAVTNGLALKIVCVLAIWWYPCLSKNLERKVVCQRLK